MAVQVGFAFHIEEKLWRDLVGRLPILEERALQVGDPDEPGWTCPTTGDQAAST